VDNHTEGKVYASNEVSDNFSPHFSVLHPVALVTGHNNGSVVSITISVQFYRHCLMMV
jgi:hypothetical protein